MTSHPADKPIGWEWAERYPEKYRDPPLASRPSACAICGHATGCTEEDHEAMARGKPQPTPEAGPTYVVVKEDVVEEVEDRGATTKRHRLRWVKGQVITEDEAREAGIMAVQQQDLPKGETK